MIGVAATDQLLLRPEFRLLLQQRGHMIVMAQIASNLFMKGNAQLSVQRVLDKPWTLLFTLQTLVVLCFVFLFFHNYTHHKASCQRFCFVFFLP